MGSYVTLFNSQLSVPRHFNILFPSLLSPWLHILEWCLWHFSLVLNLRCGVCWCVISDWLSNTAAKGFALSEMESLWQYFLTNYHIENESSKATKTSLAGGEGHHLWAGTVTFFSFEGFSGDVCDFTFVRPRCRPQWPSSFGYWHLLSSQIWTWDVCFRWPSVDQ